MVQGIVRLRVGDRDDRRQVRFAQDRASEDLVPLTDALPGQGNDFLFDDRKQAVDQTRLVSGYPGEVRIRGVVSPGTVFHGAILG